MKKFLLPFMLVLSVCLALTGCYNSVNVDKAQVEQIVHDYLLAHPEILIDMSKKLQQQQIEKQQAQAVNVVQQNAEALFNPKYNPILGDTKGAVTLVEFFDYQCIHCYHMYTVVQTVMKNNPNLRVVFFDFPIFGEVSQYAALAALYANTQGKYLAMHDALFGSGLIEGKMTVKAIDTLAGKIGLNVAAMKAYINKQNAEIKAQKPGGVVSSYTLAQALGIQGTPAFIVAPTPGVGKSSGKISFIPGASNVADLQKAIDEAK